MCLLCSFTVGEFFVWNSEWKSIISVGNLLNCNHKLSPWKSRCCIPILKNRNYEAFSQWQLNIPAHAFCLTCFLFFFTSPLYQSVNQGGDQELENLVTKLAILKDLLSSIEKKVHTYVGMHTHTWSLRLPLSHTLTHTDSCKFGVVSLDNPPPDDGSSVQKPF